MTFSQKVLGWVFVLLLCGSMGEALATSEVGSPASAELRWSLAYDEANRITAIRDPAGRETRLDYTFDADGNLLRLSRTAPDGAPVVRELDERGRLTTMTDGVGPVTYAYDDLGRLTRIARQGEPPVAYAYDSLDRLTRLAVGDFYSVEYQYDHLNRLVGMKTPLGRIRYDYLTGQGQVVRTLPNGLRTTWKYTSEGRLGQLTHGFSGRHDGAQYQDLADYRYQYDPDGRIASVDERSKAGEFRRHFQYDTVGRLVRSKGPRGVQYVYGYDRAGHRTATLSASQPQRKFRYDWAGRLTLADGQPTTHDDAGNLTELSLGPQRWQYAYDSRNQLVHSQPANISYRYDGNGILIQRATPHSTTTFITDPTSGVWRPLVQLNPDGSHTLFYWDGDLPVMVMHAGRLSFLVHDHIGTTRMVVDGRGNTQSIITSDPYGDLQDQQDPLPDLPLRPGFAGLFWDQESGIYITRSRSYSPILGRFLQLDSFKTIPDTSPDSWSDYDYCGADPVNFIDRRGTFREHFWETRFYWLKSYWSQLSQTLFDRKYALDWYKQANIKQLEGAGGHGIGAGLHASLLDLGRYMTSFGKESSALDWITMQQTLARTRPVDNILSSGMESSFLDLGAYILGGRTEASQWYAQKSERALEQSSRIGVLNSTLTATGMDLLGGFIGGRETRGQVFAGGIRTGAEALLTGGLSSGRSALETADKAYSFASSFLSSVYSSYEGNHRQAALDLLQLTSMGAGLRSESLSEQAHKLRGNQYAFPFSVSPSDIKAAALDLAAKRIDSLSIATEWAAKGIDLYDQYSAVSGSLTSQSRTSPSPVGGVYLGGAGRAFEGLGLISGITFDENQNLLLIEQGGESIALPPLRLDDLVTVFRSVYLHGEGPTVTIDPDPEAPEDAAMIVRHSEATAGTYVGWVLFQADRLMKGYTLGVDNDSGHEIESRIPGYTRIQDLLYFGGASHNRLGEGHWERFWIVPAETNRISGARRALTLLDVPLKVRTQSMKWEGGKLVDDPSGASSPGASAFVDWFTEHYDGIAAERWLTPPPESGITEPVPVFTELRRIALMTAIVETLRDRGVPLPFWMRDYEVAPVPFEDRTPGLEITRSNERIQARVFGGVQLSPAAADIREIGPETDLRDMSADRAMVAAQRLALATDLEPIARNLAAGAPPLAVRPFDHQGRPYQTAAVPGADTRALAPGRLAEEDLSVPIAGDAVISLTRHFNSFFDPTGAWGKGWTLDLPRLVELRVPVERTGEQVSYRGAYELITPLNRLYQRFSRIESVPALGDSRLMVPDETASEYFGLADAPADLLSQPTRELIRKDGESWHFSQSGDLVAIEGQGRVTLYERDAEGRVSRILGLLGRHPVAVIELAYDGEGRLESATGSRQAHPDERMTVRYGYGPTGRLATVSSEVGTLDYGYQGSWVSEIDFRPAATTPETPATRLQSFEYDARGRLVREHDAVAGEIDYRVQSDTAGSTLTVGAGDLEAAFTYDPRQRPTEARYPDGTQARWDYAEDGVTAVEIAGPDLREPIRFAESPDGRSRRIALGDRYRVDEQYDENGRLASVAENGRTLVERDWTPDGRLRATRTEGQAEHLRYSNEGLVEEVIVTPPNAQGRFDTWQSTRLDPEGRPVEIKDHRGRDVVIRYDDQGRLNALIDRSTGRNYGYRIERNDDGRIQQLESSWGQETYAYDADGALQSLEATKGDAHAEAQWEGGKLRRIRRFNGAETELSYIEGGSQAGLLRRIKTPDDLAIGYQYDDQQRITAVTIGDRTRLSVDYDDTGRPTSWSYAQP